MTYSATLPVDWRINGLFVCEMEVAVDYTFTAGHAGWFDPRTGDCDPPAGDEVEVTAIRLLTSRSVPDASRPSKQRTEYVEVEPPEFLAQYLDQLFDADDDLREKLIEAAVECVEGDCGDALYQQAKDDAAERRAAE